MRESRRKQGKERKPKKRKKSIDITEIRTLAGKAQLISNQSP